MQKILVFDIETSPMLVYAFGLRDQNIAVNQIYQDWNVIAWAAKWLGDPPSKTVYMDLRGKDLKDDRAILKPLWKLLDEADIVITQNGKNFDSPKLNARFLINGMRPPSPYLHLDTYQIVRRVAKGSSNKLEYWTAKLNKKYKKLTHKRFPGQELWNECLKDNLAAWNEMKRYNIHDVLATEEFYLNIRAWTPTSMPAVYALKDPEVVCDKCGSDDVHFNGYYVNKQVKRRRIHCKKCGGWTIGAKVKGT
jgi:DNA polymerase elongation subunit (family B)